MSLCPPRPTKISLQSFYETGCAQVYHGDCLQLLPMMGEFDWIITDPPYGTGKYGYGRRQNHGKNGRQIHNDESLDAFKEMLGSARSQNICTFAHPKQIAEVVGIFKGFFLTYRGEVIWNKKIAGLGRFRYSHETILIATLNEVELKADKTVLDGIPPARRNSHPHEKPLNVIGSLLDIIKPKSVIDPFMGTGTTLIACLERNIPCVGIEIDREYCKLAKQRLSQGILA